MLIELGDEFYFMTCKDEGGRKKKNGSEGEPGVIAEVILTLTFISFSEQKK